MTRYYYTDPIKALWMQKEFNVSLYIQSGDGDVEFNPQEYADYIDEWIEGQIGGNAGTTKIYVAEESEHIFEQKEGDIGIQDDGEYFAIAKAHDIEDFTDYRGATSPSRHWTIVIRDGKLFFNPLIENNEH